VSRLETARVVVAKPRVIDSLPGRSCPTGIHCAEVTSYLAAASSGHISSDFLY
jgi:hypothetical protein